MKGFTEVKDVDQLISEAADDETLLKLLQVNRNLLTVGEKAFRDRMMKRYPVLASLKDNKDINPEDITWAKYYLKMTYYINKLKEKYNIDYIDVSSFEPAGFLKMLDFKPDFLEYSKAKHMAEVLAEQGDEKALRKWMEENPQYKSFAMAFLLKYKNIPLFEKLYAEENNRVPYLDNPLRSEFTRQERLFLETAAESGDVEVLNYVLNKFDYYAPRNKYLTLQIGAGKSGNMEMLNYVLKLSPVGKTHYISIITSAARKGKVDFIKNFIERISDKKIIFILQNIIGHFILTELEDVMAPAVKEKTLRYLLDTYLSLGGKKEKIILHRDEIMDASAIKVLDEYSIPLR